MEPAGGDIIMMTKAYIASVELSQPPCVFCPDKFLAALDLADLKPAELCPLSKKQATEISKSANYFEAEPRCLSRAAKYLRSLVECDGTPGDLPPLAYLHSIFEGARSPLPLQPAGEINMAAGKVEEQTNNG